MEPMSAEEIAQGTAMCIALTSKMEGFTAAYKAGTMAVLSSAQLLELFYEMSEFSEFQLRAFEEGVSENDGDFQDIVDETWGSGILALRLIDWDRAVAAHPTVISGPDTGRLLECMVTFTGIPSLGVLKFMFMHCTPDPLAMEQFVVALRHRGKDFWMWGTDRNEAGELLNPSEIHRVRFMRWIVSFYRTYAGRLHAFTQCKIPRISERAPVRRLQWETIMMIAGFLF